MLEGVYEQVRLRRTGWFNRGAGWWERLRLDPTDARAGDSKLFAVVHEDSSGAPDGFATWRISQNHADNRVADDTVVLDELVALDADVELADLAVPGGNRPHHQHPLERRPDGPAVEVAHGRDRASSTCGAAPTGCGRGSSTCRPPSPHGATSWRATWLLHVDDAFHPAAAGTYRLKGSPDGAECERVDDARPDLSLGAPELGAMYLGGVAPSLYASAGRIVEHAPGALERADAMFVAHPAPYCPLMF